MPAPRGMDLHAPSHWQALDFIADLHLQASDKATFTAWQDYMGRTAADAIFILGDLFEVWVGDDVLDQPNSFEQQCVATLRATSQRTPVFVLHGNRDFLMGQALMERCGATLLPDPTLLCMAVGRWLLSHGDALCVDDLDYQAFRRQVRSLDWQTAFLAQPLAQRLAMARQLRAQSDTRKRQKLAYADVDTPTALAWLRAHDAQHLLHGHTHRPGFHVLDAEHDRTVLSDWDVQAAPPRAEVLRLYCQATPDRPVVERLAWNAAAISANPPRFQRRAAPN